jgi:hypothetical protein
VQGSLDAPSTHRNAHIVHEPHVHLQPPQTARQRNPRVEAARLCCTLRDCFLLPALQRLPTPDHTATATSSIAAMSDATAQDAALEGTTSANALEQGT